jgi:membrane protein
MSPKKFWLILKGTFAEFSEDNVLRLCAALSYYSVFSIGPLLVIVVGLAGLAFGHEHVRHQIEGQLQSLLGQNSAKTIESMMSAQKHGTSLIATIVGIAALLIGAGGVFGQLQDSLNTIWEVKTKPGAGIWGLIRNRFLSFTMVLGIGFLLLVSMVLTTFLTAVAGTIGRMLPISEVLIHILNFVVSFGIITLLFEMIFKYLPDVKIPFRKVWVGAIGTALLFTIGKYLLSLYLGRASTSSSFGAASSVILILMWVYYASLILFFGAEFTQVYAKQTGTKVVPGEFGALVSEKQRAEEGIPHEKTPPGHQPYPAPGQPTWQPQAVAHAAMPGEVVRNRPWQVVGVMFAAGFVGATVFRYRLLRKALKVYLAVHRRGSVRALRR